MNSRTSFSRSTLRSLLRYRLQLNVKSLAPLEFKRNTVWCEVTLNCMTMLEDEWGIDTWTWEGYCTYCKSFNTLHEREKFCSDCAGPIISHDIRGIAEIVWPLEGDPLNESTEQLWVEPEYLDGNLDREWTWNGNWPNPN